LNAEQQVLRFVAAVRNAKVILTFAKAHAEAAAAALEQF